jgi:hypothetical protein
MNLVFITEQQKKLLTERDINMQIMRFENGGFVIHKALHQRISAWYDNDGHLLDCEQYNTIGRKQRIAKYKLIWLKDLGQRHKQH